MRVAIAKKPQNCGKCRRPVRVGEKIIIDRRRGWVHYACFIHDPDAVSK